MASSFGVLEVHSAVAEELLWCLESKENLVRAISLPLNHDVLSGTDGQGTSRADFTGRRLEKRVIMANF